MKDSVLEDLSIMISDRLNEAFNQSEEYKEAVCAESDLYEQLKNGISEDNQQLLEQYFEAASATTAVCEAIAYRQALRDFFKVLFIDP